MIDDFTLTPHSTDLDVYPSIDEVAHLANQHSAKNAFNKYQSKKAPNTKRRQLADLALFSRYLEIVHIQRTAQDLMDKQDAWKGVTHGLIDGFIQYQRLEGYAIGSINVRLSTVKKYCALAALSGIIPESEIGLIKLLDGYKYSEGLNTDQERTQMFIPTRREKAKKAKPIPITRNQAIQLKQQPGTPQGRRDAFLMCLLLDHGFRCGEIAELERVNLDMENKLIKFYRRKVHKEQTHRLTTDSYLAAQRYLEVCTPGPQLLMGSRRGGTLQGGMSDRAITSRVCVLCERIGIQGASAHDGRHAFVTFAIANGTNLKVLQDAGGWNSIAMPARYAESQSIANEGVKLD